MKKVAVVYWSGTGNTEEMAKRVAEGANGQMIHASDFAPEAVSEYDAIAFGCPAMGSERLEEDEFQPMWDRVTPMIRGKKIALFGSYGWGGGEWMREWEESLENAGGILAADSVICLEEPDDEVREALRNLGKVLAE